MEWQKEAESIYEKIIKNSIARVPAGFRRIASAKAEEFDQEIRAQVEETARARGSGIVTEADIVETIKKWVPQEKTKLVIKILKESGVDVGKYFKKTEIFQALYG